MRRLLKGIIGILCAVSLSEAAFAADNGEVTLVAVGDMFLGARLESHLRASGGSYPFIHTSHMLLGADMVIANLESPLTTASKPFMEKQFILKAPKRAVEFLKSASVDVVTLSNNHMMDYGAEGLRDTLKVLSDNNIAYSGAGENITAARAPALYSVNGVEVAVLSYSLTYPVEFYAGRKSPGTAPGVSAMIERDIKAAKRKHDIVVVAYHWGAERMREPKPYQVALGRFSIDSGADMVVGHHPHVMQPVEIYKDRPIYYSLGNFVFGGYPTKATGGMVARVVFSPKGGVFTVKSVEAVPLNVTNREVEFRPVPLNGEAALEAMKEINMPPGGIVYLHGDEASAKKAENTVQTLK